MTSDFVEKLHVCTVTFGDVTNYLLLCTWTVVQSKVNKDKVGYLSQLSNIFSRIVTESQKVVQPGFKVLDLVEDVRQLRVVEVS